ncbi:uncharacterized protein BXZ73DRAFT_105647 [Epithele typhae]|uniref:uncharacterized protein n=1 Tax=Epithele typhae TaxID=378194 RepID=UPI0020076D83|nr:uncharacterized protein BXZ73DRAFT_105647 [Epithele typhae]KAH9916954.1 hypothetical protein BXZ73DRAFT_105647 [Epithele typhae]
MPRNERSRRAEPGAGFGAAVQFQVAGNALPMVSVVYDGAPTRLAEVRVTKGAAPQALSTSSRDLSAKTQEPAPSPPRAPQASAIEAPKAAATETSRSRNGPQDRIRGATHHDHTNWTNRLLYGQEEEERQMQRRRNLRMHLELNPKYGLQDHRSPFYTPTRGNLRDDDPVIDVPVIPPAHIPEPISRNTSAQHGVYTPAYAPVPPSWPTANLHPQAPAHMYPGLAAISAPLYVVQGQAPVAFPMPVHYPAQQPAPVAPGFPLQMYPQISGGAGHTPWTRAPSAPPSPPPSRRGARYVLHRYLLPADPASWDYASRTLWDIRFPPEPAHGMHFFAQEHFHEPATTPAVPRVRVELPMLHAYWRTGAAAWPPCVVTGTGAGGAVLLKDVFEQLYRYLNVRLTEAERYDGVERRLVQRGEVTMRMRRRAGSGHSWEEMRRVDCVPEPHTFNSLLQISDPSDECVLQLSLCQL